nr:histidine kinase [Planosporangium thailandense]
MLLTGSQGVVRIVVIGVFLAAPVAFGRYLRGVRQAARVAEERARDAERRRVAETRAARLAERAHLARDLHDIVAHHVSAIAVHAGTAQFAAAHADSEARGRDEAVRALEGIRHTAGQALAELHELLRALRESEAPDDRGSNGNGAGLTVEPEAMIVDAVERGRVSGLDIDARIDDRCAQAPLAVRVTAARVVQEALTNALKHAGPGATVRTWVGVDDQALRVEVADSGPVGDRPPLPASGYGLTGMRERAAVLGGALTAGPTGAGGWRLSMWLPLRVDA